MSTNSDILEFGLCEKFGWSPHLFDDQVVELPSFKNILKWAFLGKKLNVIFKKGLDTVKIEKFLNIMNYQREKEEEDRKNAERDTKRRLET